MPLPLRRGGRGPAEGGRASDKNRNSIPPCRSADVLTQVRDYFVRHIDFEQSVGQRTDRLRRLRYEAGQARSRLFWGRRKGALDLVLRLAAATRSAPSTPGLVGMKRGRAEPHAPHDRGVGGSRSCVGKRSTLPFRVRGLDVLRQLLGQQRQQQFVPTFIPRRISLAL